MIAGVEVVAGAQVGGDRDRVARTGMHSRQRPSAQPGVVLQHERGHRLDERRTLHVTQLSPVQVTVGLHAFRPAQEDVTGRLHRSLPLHDPFAGVGVAALRQVVLQDRSRCLLDLHEQRISSVATLEQHDERPGAHAADADHLACHVDHLEPLQQVAPVVRQRGAVVPELAAHRLGDVCFVHAEPLVQVTKGNHDRRLADDPVLAVDQLPELGQGVQAVPGARLAEVLVGLLGGPGHASGSRLVPALRDLAAFLPAFLPGFLPTLALCPACGPFAPAASTASSPSAACSSDADFRVYHSSKVPIWANWAIACR